MIVQEFTLDKYNWLVRVYYAIRSYNFEAIEEDLESLGASPYDIEDAMSNLSKGLLNEGYIYSNLKTQKTIIIIGPTTSASEFQDTLDHEKGHLAMHICLSENIEPFSEEFQYLNGSIGHALFKVARVFLCDHCRQGVLNG